MNFSEFANLLKPYCGANQSIADFTIALVSNIMEEPPTVADQNADESDSYNPIASLAVGTIERIFNGERAITKPRASKIFSHIDKQKFEEYIDLLSVNARESLCVDFSMHVGSSTVDDIGTKSAELFERIIGITSGKTPAGTVVAPNFSNSLNSNGFHNAFTPVPHSESLNLRNKNSIKLFRLNVANCAFVFENLHSFLIDNVGRYVFSRAEHEKLIVGGKTESIAARAIAALKKAGGLDANIISEELGDILLYSFLEYNLNAPKLYNKIQLAPLSASPIVNQGGVHLLSTNSDGTTFQLIFSKSKIVGDLKTAIDNAFAAVETANQNSSIELNILESSILSQSFDDTTAEYLKNIILPSNRPSTIVLNNAFGVYFGYSLGLDPSQYSNEDFLIAAEQKMINDLKIYLPYIMSKITSARLDSHSFYFYLLPLNDADSEKQRIMTVLLNGGVV